MSLAVTYPWPLFVVKVHAAGYEWWQEQDMPPTLTIGCRSLEYGKWLTRSYIGPATGAHYVYRAAPGLVIPTVEFDTYIDTHTYWTRLPPDETKFWIDEREPAEVDRFPDLTALARLALATKRIRGVPSAHHDRVGDP